jgi:hypothetical protein
MNDILSSQRPFFGHLAPQFDLSQRPGVRAAGQPASVQNVPQPPTLGQIILSGLVLFGVGYIAYKVLFEPKRSSLHCSECGRTSHTARNCPFTGERRRVSSSAEKTGQCECCCGWFRKTQLHHYRGRADDSKSMEMCHECHLHCGHNGHTQNFAIRPRYCRLAA